MILQATVKLFVNNITDFNPLNYALTWIFFVVVRRVFFTVTYWVNGC